MTKPTTAEALKIARDALDNISKYPLLRSEEVSLWEVRDMARQALAATVDVQDHIPEVTKMVELTDTELGRYCRAFLIAILAAAKGRSVNEQTPCIECNGKGVKK